MGTKQMKKPNEFDYFRNTRPAHHHRHHRPPQTPHNLHPRLKGTIMPLNQRKTELALHWHRKHYETEYIATLLNTTTKEIQDIINQHQQQTKPKKA
jgi:hypothetical protein